MSDLWALEAEMNDQAPADGWGERVARARQRVAAFNALPVTEQADILHGRVQEPQKRP